jgi:multiple sugar transport system substrate-binding protein
MTDLRGLCWDHPRCTAPMTAAARVASTEGAAIRWDARPLAAFNDQPIADVVAGYDLVFVDHPTIAEAAGTGCLTPLDEFIAPETLRSLAVDAIAGSHDSYSYAGHQWAVAVDAACQVAAVDPGRYTDEPPRTWQEVLRLAGRRPGLVGLPLYPSDAIISLISISGREPGAPDDLISEGAVEVLVELAARVDPRCFDLNPPGLLDVMASEGPAAPAYVPLLFGYTDYQRPARRHPIRFCDAPTVDGQPGGTVLGGAGLAVPTASRHPREAAAFAAWVAGAGPQRDVVCVYGGQPASRTVWADPTADELVGGFFSGTGATMRAARTRPRTSWWPRFQEAAGRQLVVLLRDGVQPWRIHAELTRTLDQYRDKESSS